MKTSTELNIEALSRENFSGDLLYILETPLTPENIERYAENALEKLVALTDKATRHYQRLPTIDAETRMEIENSAHSYFRLDNMDTILDHIIEKGRQIDALDDTIQRANMVSDVITPPDLRAAMSIVEGSGTFEQASTAPRLKTLLFVLENSFGIDLDNIADVALTKGSVHDSMMRKESYYAVETPRLDRTALICDEIGNATFIFSNSELRKASISIDDLLLLTKDALKELLVQHAGIGERIVYSDQFVADILSAYREIGQKKNVDPDSKDASVSFLIPKAPEGYKSKNYILRNWGIGPKTFEAAREELAEQLGPINIFRFSNNQPGFSPEQLDMLHKHLEEQGYIVEHAPEGVRPAVPLYTEWGVASKTFFDSVEAVMDRLGKIKTYQFGSNKSAGYDTRQQSIILQDLEAKGSILAKPPEGVRSLRTLALLWDVSYNTLRKAVDQLTTDGTLEIKNYKYNGRQAPGFDEKQQETIQSYLREHPPLPMAPEDVSSEKAMTKEWKIDSLSLKRLISNLSNELGDVKPYIFGSSSEALGYEVWQKELIKNAVDTWRKNRGVR